jgi:predicted NAD/FAD-binding protein
MKIAIVGTGVSGLVAAHMLHAHHEITVFESDTRIGGHANTVDVDVDGRSVAVDTGFIVYNDHNYPGFRALLDRLDVATQPTEMSFSVSDPRTGLEFRGSNLNAIFAQRRNLANPSFLRLLADITRFNRTARRLVAGEKRWNGPDRLPDSSGIDAGARADADETLADFVRRGRFSQSFVQQFLIPFGASIWSADPVTFMRFPVRAYARFMHNHGLLEFGRPEWRTVTGGSRRYVEALTAPFAHRIQLAMPVHKIVTHGGVDGAQLVEVLTDRGPELFDRVIVATHSDQALRMLADASIAEREVLGGIGYQRNIATLHTDERMLPRNPRARASWNYAIAENARRTMVTYWLNRLQSIETRRPLLVTLNRPEEIDPRMRIAEYEYDHPVFDIPAMAAQRRRIEIQGRRGVYFAGAYWGYGFHEDGVQSALEVVRLLESRR